MRPLAEATKKQIVQQLKANGTADKYKDRVAPEGDIAAFIQTQGMQATINQHRFNGVVIDIYTAAAVAKGLITVPGHSARPQGLQGEAWNTPEGANWLQGALRAVAALPWDARRSLARDARKAYEKLYPTPRLSALEPFRAVSAAEQHRLVESGARQAESCGICDKQRIWVASERYRAGGVYNMCKAPLCTAARAAVAKELGLCPWSEAFEVTQTACPHKRCTGVGQFRGDFAAHTPEGVRGEQRGRCKACGKAVWVVGPGRLMTGASTFDRNANQCFGRL